MAPATLASLGLLLLAPHAPALRTLSRSAAPPNASFSKEGKSRGLQAYKQGIAERLQAWPLYEQAAQVGMSTSGSVSPFDTYSCRMNESSCSLADLAAGEPTSIYPGGASRCIFGEEYMFQVFPGDSDKLAVHLEGGGACWDEVTTTMAPACNTGISPTLNLGLFNSCDGDQPLRSHTVVLVHHCSGDLHSGNLTRPWTNPVDDAVPIEQRGAANLRAVLDWAKANLDPKLSSFVFSGDSAGAIGVQVWASTLLREFKYEEARVIADSYAGVFPEKFQGEIFQDLGFCDNGLLSPRLVEDCRNGTITIPQVYRAAMEEYPDVVFGTFNSKHDMAQVLFHDVAAATQRVRQVKMYCGDVDPDACDLTDAPPELSEIPAGIDPDDYHTQVETIIEGHSEHSNFVSYFLSGGAHGMLLTAFGNCPFINYARVDLAGYWIGGRDGPQRQSVQNWTSQFLGPPRAKGSACERFGGEQDDDDWCREKQELHRSG